MSPVTDAADSNAQTNQPAMNPPRPESGPQQSIPPLSLPLRCPPAENAASAPAATAASAPPTAPESPPAAPRPAIDPPPPLMQEESNTRSDHANPHADSRSPPPVQITPTHRPAHDTQDIHCDAVTAIQPPNPADPQAAAAPRSSPATHAQHRLLPPPHETADAFPRRRSPHPGSHNCHPQPSPQPHAHPS